MDYQRYIDVLDEWIVGRSRTVIVAFLLLSFVFAAGLGGVSTDSGTEQFTENTPAQAAFEDVNREFDPPFAPDEGSTQLIQRHQNVLSKDAILDMLTAQYRLSQRPSLRVSETNSVASRVATTLDPDATTLAAQIDAVEASTPSEVRTAAREATRNPGTAALLSNDFNRQSVSASATVGTVSHDIPAGVSNSAGNSGASPLTPIQLQAQQVVSSVDGDISVFGSGIISAEFGQIIGDSLIIVVPAAVLLIVAFLVFAYRDPVDLLLGVVSLAMAIVWTFGFMGLAGIPFTQMLIAVPPLLLAVGIDFGIHAINRYREERVLGHSISDSMRITTDQLLVAFFIVTTTTVIGFGANGVSKLPPIRDFGFVAAVGITFTALIFGVFLPAAKVEADRIRRSLRLPEFGLTPLGGEETLLGRVLPVGNAIAKRAPYLFLLVVLLVTVGAGAYGTGVSTSFSQEDFLPPEQQPAYVTSLPEPFAPGTYTVTRDLNFLEDNFETTTQSTAIVYVEGDLERDSTLESIAHASRNPPDTFVAEGRDAQYRSINTVIQQYAREDPEFAALVERNDRNGNGIPDDNLETIYDRLMASPYQSQAENYLTDDYRRMQVVYTVEADASQDAITDDARVVAARYRQDATATGQDVVFQAVSDTIFTSAIQSLGLALGLTAVFLVLVYHALEGEWALGLVNLVPIVTAVTLIAASMRALNIPFNALTATILSIVIGLGVDYSAHIVHRFADEYGESNEVFDALDRTVRGTGGALAGSMFTTAAGIGVLALAITPILGQFGILTAMSIFYSFLSSIIVVPSAVVVWERLPI